MSLVISWILLTGVCVLTALVAVHANWRKAYALLKTLASLGFIGVAWASGVDNLLWSRLAWVALYLSAVGDAALAVPGKKAFRVGLAGFMAAHTVYGAAFIFLGTPLKILAVTSMAVALGMAAAWQALCRHVPPSLRRPVAAYFFIVAVMLAAGTAAGIGHRLFVLAYGAVLVAASDLAVARHRFVKPRFINKAVGLPLYYLGQILIALSLNP